ncbi:hypothetical protein [Novosphingobium sp. JCM 18896]|uniref:hypothetical protein n=1 Tax=Novosphingobium sp. JCM 18896 TaxID=2989731 RepID=UPI002223DAC7|nr:hypothetical protein [Novosphingobium sp. JCM 18896]MCW1431414.1 hypothetical protein [Novosphingobium sp. JCM 18896]
MKRAIVLCLAVAGCASKPLPFPPRADVVAMTEAKPKPGADVLTDPAANDRYNSVLEARGDRLYAAGVRLCRFFRDTGMDVDCPG